MDSSFMNSRSKITKCKTIQQYIDTHGGPEIELYESYSYILLTSFVTFTYGIALPMLFPIAMLAMINLYVSEKILLTYYYRKPQMLDTSLYDGVLKILIYAPLMMLFFGYWQLGNRQIFFNESEPIEYNHSQVCPNHSLFDFSNGINHTVIFLIYLPVFIFFPYVIKGMRRFAYWVKIWKINDETDQDFKLKKNIINENIWNYWELIPGVFQLRWYAKELQLQRELGINTLSESALE